MKRRIVFGIMFLCVLSAGLFVRLDNFSHWKENPSRYYYKDTPLFTNQDCFYYLRLARDLQEGTYEKIDKNRNVPQGTTRPTIPPLLSVLTYGITEITPFTLDWVALFLPAFLGIFLAWPIYAMGKSYGGTQTGLVAALFVLLSGTYVIRSSVGWYDTDCLNVTIICALAALMHRFAVTSSSKRYRYLLAACFCLLFGYWWWGMAKYVVTVAFIAPLLVALIFYYRPSNKMERNIIVITLGVAAILLLLWQKNNIFNVFNYIIKTKITVFPTLGLAVGEQRGASFNKLANETTGNALTFLIALAGIALFAYRWKKESLFLIIPAIIGAMSLNAVRFIIFLAPTTALGIAAISHEISNRTAHKAWSKKALVVLLAIFAIPNIQMLKKFDHRPPTRQPFQHAAMDSIIEKTPANAVIWVSWGYGHPLSYYTRRGTVADGEIHSGKHMYMLYAPMASTDYRMAANWMQFYVEQGMKGFNKINNLTDGDWTRSTAVMKEIFSAGPKKGREIILKSDLFNENEADQWLKFFFPVSHRPVYLLLDVTNIRLGWFYYGNWDFNKNVGARFTYNIFTQLQETQGRITNGRDIDIVIDAGTARYNNKTYLLGDLVIKDKDRYEEYEFIHPKKYRFEMNRFSKSGILMDVPISKAVASQLFSQMLYDKKYFTHIYSALPAYQIWQATGDSLADLDQDNPTDNQQKKTE